MRRCVSKLEVINFLLSTARVCVSIFLLASTRMGRTDHMRCVAGCALHARYEEADRVSGNWKEGVDCSICMIYGEKVLDEEVLLNHRQLRMKVCCVLVSSQSV